MTMWLRRVPSCVAPILAIAARDGAFKQSVRNSTRLNCHSSNACLSMRYVASVLTAVRCHDWAMKVKPISTRLCASFAARNHVLPTTVPLACSMVAKLRPNPVLYC